MEREKDGANDTARLVFLKLIAGGSRVTSLSMNGGKLVLTIEAEIEDNQFRAATPADQRLVDAALRPPTAPAGEPAPVSGSLAAAVAPTPVPVPVPAPSSASGIPAPGIMLGDIEDTPLMADVAMAGGSEVVRPLETTQVSDRLRPITEPKSISLGPDEPAFASAPVPVQVPAAPLPGLELPTLSLESPAPPSRPSERVANQPISLGFEQPEPQPSPLQAAPFPGFEQPALPPAPSAPGPVVPPAAAPIPAPSISLGGQDEINATWDVSQPGLPPQIAVPSDSLSLPTVDLSVPPAAQPAPPPAAAPGPALSLGGSPGSGLSLNSAPGLSLGAAPSLSLEPAAPGKELRLGGEISLGGDLSMNDTNFIGGEPPQPLMESWEPGNLGLAGPAGGQDALALSEDSSALGGERHGEPQPAISFGLGDAPAPVAAPSLSLEPGPAPLSLESPMPAVPPLGLDMPAPLSSGSPEAPLASPGLSFESPAPGLSFESPAPAPSGLSLEPPPALAPAVAPAPVPVPAPAIAPTPAPAPAPAPVPAPTPLTLDSAPQPPVNQSALATQIAPPAAEPASPPPAEKPEAGGTTVLIRYTCPKCKTQGMQAVDKVGTVVNCSNCGKAMRLVMKK